jgi:hypothetical protein
LKAFQVKPNNRSTSTTATPPGSKFALGGRVAVGLATSTAVTVPVAGWLLHKHGPVVVLAVGLLPLLPYLLTVVSFVVLYFTVSITAIIATFRAKPALSNAKINSINWLYFQITNAPVAMLTLKPLKPVIREQAPETEAEPEPPEPIPPANPEVVDKEDTPNYWKAFQHMAAQPGGAPDIVPAEDEITEPIQTVSAGRHARREFDRRADLARP